MFAELKNIKTIKSDWIQVMSTTRHKGMNKVLTSINKGTMNDKLITGN